MKTTADLVAWLRGRREELELDDDDLSLFVKTKIAGRDISGKSVEDVTRLLVISGLPGGPAHRISEALCKEINGGECKLGFGFL
jgi:hypothetical protein